MEDRVADVLSERATLDRGAAPGVIASVLLHGAAAAAIVYAAIHQPIAKTASLINIRLARMPAPVAPVAQPKPATPRIESPRPEPIKPAKTTTPPEKKTVPISPFGKSAKKGSENPVVPPKSDPTTSSQQPATIPIGGTGVAIEGDFPYTVYIERMRTLIGGRWIRPQVSMGAGTTVYFVINLDGTIRDAKVESGSGNSSFDRAALRAVIEASPLPPLPFGYNGTYLGVHLTFR
jgi:TonB family protein